MAERLFRDRREAGRVLAGLLERYRGRPDVIVLGLPRGGVPVAYEVVCATTPLPFLAVGQSYRDFTQTTDEEVRDLLRAGATARPAPGAQGLTEVAAVRSEATEVAANFDAVIHVDETRAVEPLERTAGWERGEAPETYPFAV
jgi:hypothetical protein